MSGLKLGDLLKNKTSTTAAPQPQQKAATPLSNLFGNKKEQNSTPVKPTVQVSNGGDNHKVSGTKSDHPKETNAVDQSELGTPVTPPQISAKQFQHEKQPDKFTDEAAKQLHDAFQMIRDALLAEEPGMIGQAIPYIYQTLRENPHLKDILLPEDVGLMVRAIRTQYGNVVTQKQEKKTKRATKASEKIEVNSDIDALWNSIG